MHLAAHAGIIRGDRGALRVAVHIDIKRRPVSQIRGHYGVWQQSWRWSACWRAALDAQRPAIAHNSRTIRATLGYVRPEKQTVEDQRRSATL